MTKFSQEEADSNLETSSVANAPRQSLRMAVAVGPCLVELVLVLLARPTGLGCCKLDGGACLSRADLRVEGVSGSAAVCWNVTGLGNSVPPRAGGGGIAPGPFAIWEFV